MVKLSWPEAIRLYREEELGVETFRGTNITTGLGQSNVNLGTWDQTFDNHFTDVANTVLEVGDANPYVVGNFYAKGSYDSTGAGTYVTKGHDIGVAPNTLYDQRDVSILGMGAGNFANSTGNKCSNLETSRQLPGTNVHDAEDGSTNVSEGFYQCYGHFVARMKLPKALGRPDTCTLWPAFWLLSDKFGIPDEPYLEIDGFEMYLGSNNNINQYDGAWHSAMHTHDTPRPLLAPGFITRDMFTSEIMPMNPNAIFGTDANFDWGDAFHDFQITMTPEWCILGYDNLEVIRYPMLDHYHQAFYMLVSLQVKDADPQGTKSVRNGTFATDTSWTKGSGWTISGGLAHATAVADTVELSQAMTTVTGVPYKYTYTVSNYVGGGVRIKLTGGTPVLGTTRTANGTYTETLIANGNTGIALEAVGATTLDIDGVSGVSGFVEDVPAWLEVDRVSAYQNPDWNDLAIGGTADVKTVTTALAMASYAANDGRIVNGTSASSNLTTTPTLNANGLGPKVIKKYSDFGNNPPWSGTMIPLAVGDIKTTGRHNYKWSVANDCWILLNPGIPFVNQPKCFVPPAYGVAATQVDVAAVEGVIMQDWNKLGLLPDGHLGKTSAFDPSRLTPRVLPEKNLISVVTKQPGDFVGNVPLANSPAVPARASWSGDANFRVNPANGDVFVNTGAVLTEGIKTGEVSWWSPGMPIKRGSNVCKVSIDVRPNVPFDIPLYFGANLAFCYEFNKASTMTSDGVTVIADGQTAQTVTDTSGQGKTGTQVTPANRLTFDADGLNSKPCLVSNNANLFFQLPNNPFNSPLNAMNGLAFFSDSSAGIAPSAVFRRTDAYAEQLAMHSILMKWDASGVTAWVNGSPKNVIQAVGNINSVGWILFFGQTDPFIGNSCTVYGGNDSNQARLFQSASGSGGWKGKAGVLVAGRTFLNQADLERVIAHVHHTFLAQNLLPASNPYKVTPPSLFG